ncbi:succinylglutamate desuccinylase [Ferrimonas gelatinilytica]
MDLLSHTLRHAGERISPKSWTLSDGTRVTLHDVGILSFEPAKPGPGDIVLSAGVHGNETAPQELLNGLVTGLINGALRCQNRLLVLFGNPLAMAEGVREVEANMNRMFSGGHRQYLSTASAEAERAALLENSVEAFFTQRQGSRYHYDLHTAIRASKRERFAIYPFRHGKPWRRAQLAFLANGGVDTVLLSHDPTHTLSYFSSDRFGADAFTVELGKVRPFGQNDLERLAPFRDQLIALIEDSSPNLSEPETLTVFDVAQVIIKETEDFRLHFADDAANFTPYPRGTLLASDGVAAHRVKAEEEAIVFPNAKVANGQRACLTVVPVGADQPFE